jgi:hypothetical protein
MSRSLCAVRVSVPSLSPLRCVWCQVTVLDLAKSCQSTFGRQSKLVRHSLNTIEFASFLLRFTSHTTLFAQPRTRQRYPRGPPVRTGTRGSQEDRVRPIKHFTAEGPRST